MGYIRSGEDGSTDSPPPSSRAGQVGKFLGISALTGIVLAGIVLPAAGAVGLSAKHAATQFDDLPGDLKRPPLSQASRILDANGGLIATVYSRDRTVVPLTKINPNMQKAIVAIEDSRYWQHGPIDPKGILRALGTNASDGGVSEGASTLTQQYVKNVFIEEAGDDPKAVQAATRQTIGRKIKELKYAIQVEKELGKKKILENYLNITFFGEQAYGVEAASERYFGTHASDLTLDQSALLAGIVQSPSGYDPLAYPKNALDRRNTVLMRMAQLGDITQAQAKTAQAQPLGLKPTTPKNGCITAVRGAGFFCDYVRESFLNDPVYGKTAQDRAKVWNTGGLTIRTTLDPKAQDAVQAAIQQHVYKSDSVATAVSLIQPGTGKIEAMGQSRPYGFGTDETQINYNVDSDMGGGTGFQTGSTFKPITAAADIDQGGDPNQVLPAPYSMAYPSPVSTCDGSWDGGGTVQNESKSEVGPMNMKKAMALSVNTYFVQLISNIGICPVVQMEKKMGVHKASGAAPDQNPAITLGSQSIAPLTMANAYATFANGGVYCTPVAIESITSDKGKALPAPATSCTRAMSVKTADTLNTLLRGVVEDGTGTLAGLKDRDSAGKTGTTDSLTNAWFVGYTSNLAGAVWVGGPNTAVPMYNITIGGVYHAQVMGADTPGPIWHDAMSGALADTTSPPLPTVALAGDKKNPPAGGATTPPGSNPSSPPVTDPTGAAGGTADGGTANGGAGGGTAGGNTAGGANGNVGGILSPAGGGGNGGGGNAGAGGTIP
ncbi:transglycosylase domain-containing protein [Streptomyces sp. SL13]|uniref:Transglycosylase domain-containing protein n=1 Tax=Streptantibioticus silvisoli TaxID=2705255 RepID=A0AA90GXN6_9ACTN|nr:transglycosylase domain-containing protein [Streptantibioticus silvisoli]MDI5962978.1 transglycosylase domain-containing protein [Streptantibioticus silvisoli]MDI5969789.1 transglycosylase domain-containing protein [Streptantibioticus silvisoli]